MATSAPLESANSHGCFLGYFVIVGAVLPVESPLRVSAKTISQPSRVFYEVFKNFLNQMS